MLDKAIREVFSNCHVNGNYLYLPEIELERSLFLKIKKRILLAGGNWRGGKTQGFIFDFPPTEVVVALSQGKILDFKQDNQFFETPEETIATMVAMADIQKGDNVLEPSAGRFAIGRWLWEYSLTYDRQPIDCYELNKHNQQYLRKYPYANLVGDDFLLAQPQKLYDVILANPPFTKSSDIRHVMHMANFLKPSGVIVSVMSTAWQRKDCYPARIFHDFLKSQSSYDVYDLPEDSFKESGTTVDTCVVVIQGKDFF